MDTSLLFNVFECSKQVSKFFKSLLSTTPSNADSLVFADEQSQMLNIFSQEHHLDKIFFEALKASNFDGKEKVITEHKHKNGQLSDTSNSIDVSHKISRFRLSDDISSRYVAKVENYFKEKKPYLDPELSMTKMAKDLDIPLHHLSLVINTKLGCGFSDYVNMYRIEEVKGKLKDQRFHSRKVESIGYECGFNSKATFNRVFKKHCNQTPSAYQQLDKNILI